MEDATATEPHASPLETFRATVAEKVSTRDARTIAAVFSAIVCALATSGGIFAAFGQPQSALVVGAAAGIFAPSRLIAVLAASVAWVFGSLLGPTDPLLGQATTALRLQHLPWMVLAGAVALGLAVAAQQKGIRRLAVWVVAILLIVNMWSTAYGANSRQMTDPNLGRVVPSMFQQLEGSIAPEYVHSDEYFYLKMIRRMDQGQPYYRAFGEEQLKHFGAENPLRSPIMVREPLGFLVWSKLPGVGSNLVWMYLVLASIAVLCVPVLIGRVGPVSLALPGLCLVAAYLLYASIGIQVLMLEPWCGALGIIALALTAVAGSSPRWKSAESAAAVFTVAVVLIRELMLVLPVAGLFASLMARGARMKYRSIVWGSAVLVSVSALAVHWSQASKLVTGSGGISGFFKGGWANLISGVGWGATFFGHRGSLVTAFAVLGVLGALAIRERRLFWYATAVTVAPLVLFLFVGNGAIDPVLGTPINYWGAAYVPSLLALVPLVLAWLPGLSVTPIEDS